MSRVSRPTMWATAARPPATPSFSRPLRDIQHVRIEAALGQQAAGQHAAQDERDDAGKETIEQRGERDAPQQRDHQEQYEREDPVQSSLARRSRA